MVHPFSLPFVRHHTLEEFRFLADDLAEQQVSESRSTHAEPLVGEPFLAQNLLHDGVVDECIHHAIQASSGLKTNLYARSS